MSLLTSPADGLQQIGWRRIVVTALAFCLAPAAIGGAALAAIMLTGIGSLQAEGPGLVVGELVREQLGQWRSQLPALSHRVL